MKLVRFAKDAWWMLFSSYPNPKDADSVFVPYKNPLLDEDKARASSQTTPIPVETTLERAARMRAEKHQAALDRIEAGRLGYY